MDFSIDGIEYKAIKVDAVKQFHLARRLSPFLESVFPIVVKFKSGQIKIDDPESSFDALLDSYTPFAKMISELSDEQADYILFGLLACIRMKEKNGLGWPAISSGNALMQQNINAVQMMKLAYHAFMENLADFFPQGVATLNAIKQKQSAQ